MSILDVRLKGGSIRPALLLSALLVAATLSEVRGQHIIIQDSNNGPSYTFYESGLPAGRVWRVQSRVDFSRTPSQVLPGQHVGYPTWQRPGTSTQVKYADLLLPTVAGVCLDLKAYSDGGMEFHYSTGSSFRKITLTGSGWPRVRVKTAGSGGRIRMSATEANSTRVFSFVAEEVGTTQTCQVSGVAYLDW